MNCKNLVFHLLLLLTLHVNASHLIGMELNYKFVRENAIAKEYLINVNLIHSCENRSKIIEKDIGFKIYDSNGVVLQKIVAPQIKKVFVNDIAEGPCLESSFNRCLTQSTYSAIVSLPLIDGDYRIVYEKCCRENDISNLRVSGSQSMAVETYISGRALNNNSSPIFEEHESLNVCLGDEFYFDFSAEDPDGDSLSYSFYHSIQGKEVIINTKVIPPLKFRKVHFKHPFTHTRPFPTTKNISIDAITGLVTGIPAKEGTFQWGIKIDEYRDGKLINSNLIDRSIRVVRCSAKNENVDFEYSMSCKDKDELKSIFKSTIEGEMDELWNIHGVLITNDPKDSLIHLFQNEGKYNISLVVNPGMYCADTITKEISVLMPPKAEVLPFEQPCLGDSIMKLRIDTSAVNNKSSFEWTTLVNGRFIKRSNKKFIEFKNPLPGRYEVHVKVQDEVCNSKTVKTFEIHDKPRLDISVENGCEGKKLDFHQSTNRNHQWQLDWKVDGKEIFEPSKHIFKKEGMYKLDIQGHVINDKCLEKDTFSTVEYVKIYPRPRADFEFHVNESLVPGSYKVEYSDNSDHAFDAKFLIDEKSYNHPVGILEAQSGDHIRITQIAYSQNGYCADTTDKIVQIPINENVLIPNAFTPNGDGINDSFQIFYRDIINPTLCIYNRTGKVVFHTDNLQNSWDSTYQGQVQKTDSYVYKLTYFNAENEMKTKQGVINLIR